MVCVAVSCQCEHPFVTSGDCSAAVVTCSSVGVDALHPQGTQTIFFVDGKGMGAQTVADVIVLGIPKGNAQQCSVYPAVTSQSHPCTHNCANNTRIRMLDSC